MKKLLFIIASLIAVTSEAQVYSLQQCIDAGLANSLDIKGAQLNMNASNINRKQARTNMLPDLNASINHGINQGRSIDPFTNQYATQQINYAGYNVNSDVVLFQGFGLQNAARGAAYVYDATKMEWQQAKDNLTLNIIIAYLQVLNNEDIIVSAANGAALSKQQLERLEILDKNGAVKPSEVSDIRGQYMNDQLTLINARTNLETSKLALAQLMNIQYSKEMQLQRIPMDDIGSVYGQSSQEVFERSLQQFAAVKAVELRTKGAQYAWKVSKGALLPSVYFNANANTNFSSAASNGTGKIPYQKQLNNNVFTSMNVGVRIPIFNASTARNKIQLAAIDLKKTTLEEERTKLLVRQQIEQASLQAANSYERYNTLLQQVEAYQQSFTAAEVRFNAGVGTTVDYLLAKNNLDRAAINLIMSKYDFILRKKVLDYYQNIK
ncbi:MAG TPA: TolC family protein [Chitinophagaceae bacterium]|nr:TolC family protein [Chitinophagaceae bacterium]